MNIPGKIYEERQNSCPLGVSIKGIARAFKWLKRLGGFLHLKPIAGCQISTLIFEFSFGDLWRGSLWISHEKYIKVGKVLVHLWPPMHFRQLKASAIPLIENPSGQELRCL
jgi:hypothetical protein